MKLTLKTASIQLELQYTQTTRQLMLLKENIRENGATWTDNSRLQALQEQVVRLQRARERLQQGQYGLCLACGTPIDSERLELVPTAELCIECNQKNVQNTLRNRRFVATYQH